MTYTKQKLASERGGASAFTRSPQEALRSLGSLKHLIWLLNQHSSVHFAVMALISGRATPRDWRRALDQLQKRHPILLVCIDRDQIWSQCFVRRRPYRFPFGLLRMSLNCVGKPRLAES